MHRIDEAGHVSNLFTEGNPSLGVPATKVGDDWLNAVQEELCNAVEADGTALVKGTNTQLRTILSAIIGASPPGGRLTLSSGVPVTTSDVTGATAVKYTPYLSDRIPLWNGTRWVLHTFSETSQALSDTTKSPAATAVDTAYDLFAWDDAGTFRVTRGPAWTNYTTRSAGTDLTLQDGRWLNTNAITNGPGALRGLYVGTIHTDGSNTVNDSKTVRNVWNTFNRVPRYMRVQQATASWDYTTATDRYANGSISSLCHFVLGLEEDCVQAKVLSMARNDNAGVSVRAGIGLDSASVVSGCIYHGVETKVINYREALSSQWSGCPAAGVHYLAWLEWSAAGTGTTTWLGGNETGMEVIVRA